MKKFIISLLLTIALGPGAGHIYLRYFFRGALLLLSTVFVGIHFFWQVSKTAPSIEALNQNAAQFFQEFARSHSNTVFYYDVIFAAIWAYALVDIYFTTRAPSPPSGTVPGNGDNNE